MLGQAACEEFISLATNMPLVGVDGIESITYKDLASNPHIRAKEPILSLPFSGRSPLVQQLAADPLLLEPVSTFLGYWPVSASSWLFWSLCNDLPLDQRENLNQTVRFHYDVDGLNFIYVNFYLTETTIESGAHALIEGTHRGKTARQLLGSSRIDEDEARRCFGDDRVRVIEGAPGSGFFEDASCYHKAIPPRTGDRLMLQIRYR